ncbi:ABC transporter ATP-binding protein, partial [Lacticaseibacillus paracasei]
MSEIRIEGAKKVYGDVTVIENLSLTVPDGALFTLLGPSGCGKTTLLRMIAGFNSIEGGDFYFGDNRINNMEPSKRNIGMVFQNYAIFPHLTVRDNVAFGLKQKKATKEKVVAETDKYLKLMQIDEYRDRKPDQLSGGQQQRVALARALAVNPDVLLMDEPLSNLDAKLRVDMRQAIREIQREVGITTVYVTHDQEEAMAISDSIAVMNQGRIQQVGRPKELYHRPKNEFVASFIGRTNIIQANLKHDGATALLEFSTGYRMPLPILNNVADQPVHVSIRPEELIRTADGDIDAQIT